jgi:hypothetical protein
MNDDSRVTVMKLRRMAEAAARQGKLMTADPLGPINFWTLPPAGWQWPSPMQMLGRGAE